MNSSNGLRRRRLPALALTLALPLSVAVSAAPRPAAKPAVQAVDGPGLKKAIVANRGKVVVLNLWATWCGPCVEEFPALVKLQNAYRSKGLVVLAASVDDPQTQSKVVPFLATQKAKFSAFIRKPGDVETFINAVDKEWSGAVPTTYLFDRNGNQVGKPMIGGQSYARFVAAVEPLLK